MIAIQISDGALLFSLLAAPTFLLATAKIRDARSRRNGKYGPPNTEVPDTLVSYAELDQPLSVMQRQVDILSRAHDELSQDSATAERVAELEAEISEAAAWIAELLDDRDRSEATQSRMQRRLDSMSTQLERLRNERDEVLQRSTKLTDELRNTRRDVLRLSEMLERSEMEKRSLQDELGRLTPRMAELVHQLGELTAERDQLRTELDRAQKMLLDSRLATEHAERVLERALEKAPIAEVRQVESDVRRLRRMGHERNQQVAVLAERLDSADFEATEVRHRLAVGRPIVDQLQVHLGSTKEDAHEISTALTNARQRIDRLQRNTRPRSFAS